MGLSEREQQLLDDMERRLYQSEADVMQTSSASKRLNLRSVVLGIIVLIVGVVLLLTGVTIQQWWLGLLGFVGMLGGVLLGLSRREEIESRSGSSAGHTSRGSFSERMTKRWEDRMEGER